MQAGSFLLICLAAAGLCLAAPGDQEWTRFRGPDGTGIAEAQSIPVSFTEADYNWKVKLPAPGHSSPVLWGNRIFLTCAERRTTARQVVCLDSADGRVIWSWKDRFKPYRQNRLNSFAASTPALDARHVYICWVSGQTFTVLALDHQGKKVWQREIDGFASQHGPGGSAIVLDGVVIAANDNGGKGSFLIGLDARTGKTQWKQDRRSGLTPCITPGVYRPKGGPAQAIFVSSRHGMTSLDPKTGKTNWELSDLFELRSVASPVVAGGVILATAGKGNGSRESAVVRPGGKSGGNPQVAYRLESAVPYVPTAIAVGKNLFTLSDTGTMTCLVAETGKSLWQQKLGGRYYSSPVCANGRIYCISREGEAVVIEAADKFKLLARNKLPEGSHATPAIAGGRMYIRTYNHLISIGGKKKAASSGR